MLRKIPAYKRFYYKAKNYANDIILKLKMFYLYSGSYKDWYKDVWLQDPDQQMCCNGQMCGCQGSCYYQMWEHLWSERNKKFL